MKRDVQAELRDHIRTQICERCPLRSRERLPRKGEKGRKCESVCPIFKNLSLLAQYARNLDPMVGSYDGAVKFVAGKERRAKKCKTKTASKRLAALKRHGPEIAGILRQLGRR
jgi:hypothetical protein